MPYNQIMQRQSHRTRGYTRENAAREALRADPNSSLNGPVMMSTSAQQAQQRRHLLPTAYIYIVPQVKSSKCNLCRLAGNHDMDNRFVGHDAPVHRHLHRHLMCMEHYRLNKRLSADRCPECRVHMGEWQIPVKAVRIAADGTEDVMQQPGGAAAVAAPYDNVRDDSGGKKRKHTRGRRLRRRSSSKKSTK